MIVLKERLDREKCIVLLREKQEELMSMYDGLKLEIANIPKDYVPEDSLVGIRMDEYLKKHDL